MAAKYGSGELTKKSYITARASARMNEFAVATATGPETGGLISREFKRLLEPEIERERA